MVFVGTAGAQGNISTGDVKGNCIAIGQNAYVQCTIIERKYIKVIKKFVVRTKDPALLDVIANEFTKLLGESSTVSEMQGRLADLESRWNEVQNQLQNLLVEFGKLQQRVDAHQGMLDELAGQGQRLENIEHDVGKLLANMLSSSTQRAELLRRVDVLEAQMRELQDDASYRVDAWRLSLAPIVQLDITQGTPNPAFSTAFGIAIRMPGPVVIGAALLGLYQFKHDGEVDVFGPEPGSQALDSVALSLSMLAVEADLELGYEWENTGLSVLAVPGVRAARYVWNTDVAGRGVFKSVEFPLLAGFEVRLKRFRTQLLVGPVWRNEPMKNLAFRYDLLGRNLSPVTNMDRATNLDFAARLGVTYVLSL